MAVSENYAPDQVMLVMSITSSLTEPLAFMEDLNDALNRIEASLGNRDIWFRSIDVSGKWEPGDEEFDPEAEEMIYIWREMACDPDFRDPMHSWLGRVEHLIKAHDEIWESETIQLGEVPASVFAVSLTGFVADFVRLLDLWDLGHSVNQPMMIEHVLRNHGVDIPEAKDLLRIKDEWGL